MWEIAEGMLFDLKQFAVFDGPGIRQTVFMKGCPLRCRWCHNPEGLVSRPQMMVGASCTHCGRCRTVCRHETCIACGACVPVCPLHLRHIAGETITAEELTRRLRRDSDYYAACGGGVTFSGGEPLMQGAFLLEVLALIPEIHTCIETSGYAPEALFNQVVEQLDYVIMDIKIFDRELHRAYTGVDNALILKNAKWLCNGDTPFTIRIPLIPGVNDNDENLRQTAQWIAGARKLEKVELLPYQKTAGAKYCMLGQEYQPGFDVDCPVHAAQDIFEEYGIRSSTL